jgi:UDP-N-acetylglucosamine 2-epimerase (non-hydrolysing)
MIKVLSVFGTRPEAIKMAPLLRELARRTGTFTSRVCVTGQHREMLDQALQLFSIRPDYDLNVMAEDQTPSGVALLGIVKVAGGKDAGGI